MFSFFKKKPATGCITFNQKPIRSSWGGGNQWLLNFVKFLERNGYRVNYKLGKMSDCVFIVNSKGLVRGGIARRRNHITFGLNDLREFKRKHGNVPCIHRINDSDIHRGTNFIDDIFEDVNSLCEHTVFISEWIFRYHSQKWWKNDRPYSIINGGADPGIFNPSGGNVWDKRMPFRIVTHHWSNNMAKGFTTYKELDDRIFEGLANGIEFYFIGNYPKEIKWRASKAISPLYGKQLADMLRKCHAYLTASKYEASGMHWIEGIQCGLPLIYSKSGGAIADAGKEYGVALDGDVVDAIVSIKENYDYYRQKVLNNPPSSERTNKKYFEIIRRAVENN